MSHPYDASTKYLVETRLADWLSLCGRTTSAELRIIDADLATVTAAADRVLHVFDKPPWLLHLELQASRDRDLLLNLPVYNVLLSRRHRMPVRTVVVLLRKSADWPELNGTFQQGLAGESPYLVFRYEVVRVWQLPPETFLNGGLGILPMAPLSAVAEADLPDVIRRMDERIRAEATPAEAGPLRDGRERIDGAALAAAIGSSITTRSKRRAITWHTNPRYRRIRDLPGDC
jgi:hypothetical protein